MTLGTHAAVGATIAAIIPEHALVAFAVGFASHFILDAVPHWDYKLKSTVEDDRNPLATDMKLGRGTFADLSKIGTDGVIGLAVAFFVAWFFGVPLVAAYAGAIGAMLPDALQFAYWKIRKEPLVSLQRFHLWIHTKRRLANPIFGAALQAAFAAAVILCVWLMLLV